jgi:hypothetical protein
VALIVACGMLVALVMSGLASTSKKPAVATAVAMLPLSVDCGLTMSACEGAE